MEIEHTPDLDQQTARANARLIAAAPDLLAACKAIRDVQVCMMMQGVHADFIMHEILEKHGVPNVQLLAKKAQDLAKAAIDRAEGGPSVCER